MKPVFACLFLFSQLFSGTLFAATPAFPKIVDETALNEKVDPCDDFYQFSCGTWIDNTVIPPEKKAVYRQSTPMADAVDVRLNTILDAYARGDYRTPATYATKLGDYYVSCMTADKNTVPAIQALKAKIQALRPLRTAKDFARIAATLQRYGVSLFSMMAMQDYNDSTSVIADIAQAGMVLKNPAYYLDSDKKSVETRLRYKDYVAQMFALLGATPEQAQQIAGIVLRNETRLATKAYSITDQSDPDKVNHVLSYAELRNLTPTFDWSTYLTSLAVPPTRFNVDEPEFIKNMDVVIREMSESDRLYYFAWQLMDHVAPFMGGRFEKAHFDFWGSYMTGAKAMPPRWKLCTEAAEQTLGYALAEAYEKTFDGQAIAAKTNSMIDEIKNMFVTDLQMLSTGAGAWIDGLTVREAIAKAQAIVRKVGGPDKFRDYSSLEVNRVSYLDNTLAVATFESKRDIAKIAKPVDKTEWQMMPWEVNAYYDRSNNEFVFPFGILQPPSLDLEASDGANYGAFGGGTIGHELTHGFDSAGSKYDMHGNLKDWWTPTTHIQFDKKAQCYAKQASQYAIKSVNLYVDGAQTLEENLADQGGVKLGYMVLDKILKGRPETPPWLGRYSERQQYWIAYAQSWCSKPTLEALRSQMKNDVHPPSEFRVNAVVMNRPEFAADFKCAAGKKMAPVNRCALW
jgi:endothelin-converting enzyme/putative endopeptidase